jgi:hypothetical protein
MIGRQRDRDRQREKGTETQRERERERQRATVRCDVARIRQTERRTIVALYTHRRTYTVIDRR